MVNIPKIPKKAVDHLQEWATKYLDAPQHLEMKGMIDTEIEKVQLRLHHQNYMYLGEYLISTISA